MWKQQEKQLATHKGAPLGFTVDFSSEVMETRREAEWHIQSAERKISINQETYPAKLSFIKWSHEI